MQNLFKKTAFLLAIAFTTLVFAATHTVDVGSSGDPQTTTAFQRSSFALGKLLEIGGTFGPGDRIIARFNDGWITEIRIEQIEGNLYRPVEVVAPYKLLSAGTGGGGGEGAGGCGGGGGYFQPTGYWESYAVISGNNVTVGYQFISTGSIWVPQNCN